MAPSISAEIEIAASPESVRAVVSCLLGRKRHHADTQQFMDWQHYNEWHQNFNFKPLDSSRTPMDLQPGDKMRISAMSISWSAEILVSGRAKNTSTCTCWLTSEQENSASSFQWGGSLLGLFNGTHQFYFSPSLKTPGATRFLQKEDFSGLFAFLMREGSRGATGTQEKFAKLNSDLKAEAERRERQRVESSL
jgi:hypothetical protein